MRTRAEHLQWCKERALEYVEAGQLTEALASMGSDLNKHEETKNHSAVRLGLIMVEWTAEYGPSDAKIHRGIRLEWLTFSAIRSTAMNLTPEMIAQLTMKIEGMIELELDKRLPFVCLMLMPGKDGFAGGESGLAVFTNRRSNLEVQLMLEDALNAVKKADAPWKAYDP